MATKIIYRNGYPTKKSIKALLNEYNIHGVMSMDSYESTHSICWGGNSKNENMLNFVDTLSNLGIKVSKFKAANSPTTGSITFEKVIKNK